MKPFEQPIYVTQPILPDLDELAVKLKEIWGAKWLTNHGRQHNELKDKLRVFLKVPHLSLFTNGTIALATAVRCLELNGEVITSPFTFPATPHVLFWNNVTPVFCDIDEQSLTINADALEQMITPKTTGILGVHVYGNPCNVLKLQKIANKHGLKIIYDAAHAFGSEIDGVGIGNFGDISMFSFHATKVFHTAEGGALTFKEPAFETTAKLLKNFGIKNEEEVVLPGINGKMNEIQAALGLINLTLIEEEWRKREKISATYKRCLAGIEGVRLCEPPSNVRNSYQYVAIRINKDELNLSRDEVYERFKKYNVFTRKYFYPLCSDYAHCCQLPSSAPSNLPIARKVASEVLCMPLYGDLELGAVEKICELLRSFNKVRCPESVF